MKKKILILSNSLSGGGAEDSAFLVYNSLIEFGLNVNLCVINTNKGEPIAEEIYSLSREWKSGALATYKSLRNFRKLIRVLQPDVIIAHCELPELFAASLMNRNLRIICVEHTSRPWHGRRLMGILVRLFLKFSKTDWVTVSSDSPKIWFGNRSPIYIPNPSKRPISVKNRHDDKKIVFIGRLRKEKRSNWAIEAAIANKSAITLYGEGEELENLKNEFSKELNSITFKGYIKNPWSEINEESLIIVPSEFEGDGLVVVESVLNGNPLLLADNIDLRRFNLPNQNYFKSKKELIEKIGSTNPGNFSKFAIPAATRNRLESERRIENIVTKWVEILE